MYTKSCCGGPRYNGTGLYIDLDPGIRIQTPCGGHWSWRMSPQFQTFNFKTRENHRDDSVPVIFFR